MRLMEKEKHHYWWFLSHILNKERIKDFSGREYLRKKLNMHYEWILSNYKKSPKSLKLVVFLKQKRGKTLSLTKMGLVLFASTMI